MIDELERFTLPDGAMMHSLDRGTGDCLLLVHGGGRDLRAWLSLAKRLSTRCRVIAPSRRYAWPNENGTLLPDYSPAVDAADLADVLDQLGVKQAIVVGSSMGAAAAVHLAVARPELVAALSLAEPPIHRWADRTAQGALARRVFMERAWHPAAAAFAAGDAERAMRILLDHFLGADAFDRLLPAVRARLMENARDFEAQTRSSDAFPDPGRDAVAAIGVPVQMLSGENTLRLHAIVDEEVATVMTGALRVQIAGARHDVWADAGRTCTDELETFLDGVLEGSLSH